MLPAPFWVLFPAPALVLALPGLLLEPADCVLPLFTSLALPAELFEPACVFCVAALPELLLVLVPGLPELPLVFFEPSARLHVVSALPQAGGLRIRTSVSCPSHP